MCQHIESAHLASGWICCGCRIYNGIQRTECKQCNHARCASEAIAPNIGSPASSIPREHLDSIIADLVELLNIGERLLPKIEAEVARMSFLDLVKALNEIEMPEKASQQFQAMRARLPAILGVDPAMIQAITQMSLGNTHLN